MVRLFAKILFFPVAALLLGAAWQTLHPVGFWSLQTAPAADDDGFMRVHWEEAAPHIAAGEWILADARDVENFRAGHIPGAVSLPANAYADALLFFAGEHGTAKPVVVYCGAEDCDLSLELAARLRDEAGIENVRILDGGFLAWRRTQK